MIAAPLIVPLADRYSRKWIMAAGAFVWSAATLLSAVTHNYHELLLRHVLVGIGEATFVAISPAFPVRPVSRRNRRGRVMGHVLPGDAGRQCSGLPDRRISGSRYGWRSAVHGLRPCRDFCWPSRVLGLREPVRGASDHLADSSRARLDSRPVPQQSVLDHHAWRRP